MKADRDLLNKSLLRRALTPSQCRAVAMAFDQGVRAVVLASQYGVDRRTIYRSIKYGRQPVARAVVGDWWAEFYLPPDGPPTRATEWMALP